MVPLEPTPRSHDCSSDTAHILRDPDEMFHLIRAINNKRTITAIIFSIAQISSIAQTWRISDQLDERERGVWCTRRDRSLSKSRIWKAHEQRDTDGLGTALYLHRVDKSGYRRVGWADEWTCSLMLGLKDGKFYSLLINVGWCLQEESALGG